MDVAGDNNCQFNALCHQLGQQPQQSVPNPLELREACVDWLSDNRHIFMEVRFLVLLH